MPRPDWAIILHAGARRVAVAPVARSSRDDDNTHTRAVCRAALTVGEAVLIRGGSAVDAVAATLVELEKDPSCNAGYGSVLNADGEVEMDAAIMDGATLDIGAVGAIRGVRHPADVALRLLRTEPVLLVADGARRFAIAHGAELRDEHDFARIKGKVTEPAGADADTVGCVAFDRHGNFAAGTSTGGLSGKLPGRVGDSPLPGCGFYADNARGGVSFSGIGERIARKVLAARTMEALASMDAQAAAETAIVEGAAIGGGTGVIVIDAQGRIGWAHDTEQFAVAYVSAGAKPEAYASRGEL